MTAARRGPDAPSVASHLILDIETVLDAQLPIVQPTETERLPPPPHHQIVVIGVLWLDARYAIKRLGVIGEGKPEAEMLRDFAKFLDSHKPNLVTYNGRGFDLPVITARCLRHGVPLRHYYKNFNVRYRFSPEGHLDLMDYIADFGASQRSRLDIVAKLCGMPGKVGIDGKDVGPMVHAGRLTEVRDYCLCDVVQTAGVFLRLQLVRGELSVDTYREAMQGLVDHVQNDERVAPVARGLDVPRLMIREEA